MRKLKWRSIKAKEKSAGGRVQERKEKDKERRESETRKSPKGESENKQPEGQIEVFIKRQI